jgi:hypothetical protein
MCTRYVPQINNLSAYLEIKAENLLYNMLKLKGSRKKKIM